MKVQHEIFLSWCAQPWWRYVLIAFRSCSGLLRVHILEHQKVFFFNDLPTTGKGQIFLSNTLNIMSCIERSQTKLKPLGLCYFVDSGWLFFLILRVEYDGGGYLLFDFISQPEAKKPFNSGSGGIVWLSSWKHPHSCPNSSCHRLSWRCSVPSPLPVHT